MDELTESERKWRDEHDLHAHAMESVQVPSASHSQYKHILASEIDSTELVKLVEVGYGIS